METPNIDKLIEEHQKLKAAAELLKAVWIEIGPYPKGLKPETVTKLQQHFEYDDSE